MIGRYIQLLMLAALPGAGHAQMDGSQAPKRLVVCIAVDQLRTDCLEAFALFYGDDGFKKLYRDGIVYANAAYPYLLTDRASAVATLVTGTPPYYNSIVGARWMDRATLRPVGCVDDTAYEGLNTDDQSSPANISTSTIGDELKMSTGGAATVWSIAPFRDAAVLAGGHAADGAVWIDDTTGQWCSSTYYFSPLPSWLWLYNNAHPAADIDAAEWTPAVDITREDAALPDAALQHPFDHKFKGANRYREYKTSALVNERVTDIAIECVKSNNMGADAAADLLCITYYAGNYNDKATRDCRPELIDTYIRLDRTIADLLRGIESSVGEGSVLVVLTSTASSNDDNADYSKYRVPTGTFDIARATDLLNLYFGALYGQGRYIEAGFGTHFFLDHKLIEQKKLSLTEATTRAKELLLQMAGVRNVYTSLQLISSDNEHTNTIRNGYHPDRCGDVIVEVSPGWKIVNEPFKESSLSKYSHQQFPIIIYGTGQGGSYETAPVTTDRIAPTIAKTIRIRAPNGCAAEPLL